MLVGGETTLKFSIKMLHKMNLQFTKFMQKFCFAYLLNYIQLTYIKNFRECVYRESGNVCRKCVYTIDRQEMCVKTCVEN